MEGVRHGGYVGGDMVGGMGAWWVGGWGGGMVGKWVGWGMVGQQTLEISVLKTGKFCRQFYQNLQNTVFLQFSALSEKNLQNP